MPGEGGKARSDGQYSRRYKDSVKHMEARARVEARVEAWGINSDLRDGERAQRTPKQQLARLDRQFGRGQGAARERARLMKLVEQKLGDVPFGEIDKRRAAGKAKAEEKAKVDVEKDRKKRVRELKEAEAHYEAVGR